MAITPGMPHYFYDLILRSPKQFFEVPNSSSFRNIVAINGCCYGMDNNPEKGSYSKLCGQRFWEFVSGDETLYLDIIEPLGHRAKEYDEEFQDEYPKVVNRFTREFLQDFCNLEGEIDWAKIVELNSGKEKRQRRERKKAT